MFDFVVCCPECGSDDLYSEGTRHVCENCGCHFDENE